VVDAERVGDCAQEIGDARGAIAASLLLLLAQHVEEAVERLPATH
jgi:hypothetical protein